MSAAHQRHQISQICGKEETQKDANELLNIALSKTGPGSGHDLGEKAIALPAICAFLASERLGNNDVVKKVAQDVSCLRQKDFEAALSTVRGALSGYLSRKPGRDITYEVLCQTHGLNDDVLYWLEEVDKELRKSGELRSLDAGREAVIYVVFYWTCIALNIRSVKQATIISEYGVPLDVFQDLEEILDSTCTELKESMGKFTNEARTGRSAGITPHRTSRKNRPGLNSPSKEKSRTALTTFSTPTKTQSGATSSHRLADSSPSKRRAVLPPLPFMTPTKKQKTSPIKLNRILPVTSNSFTSSKATSRDATSNTSPLKTYTSARSFADSPTNLTRLERSEEAEAAQLAEEAQVEATIFAESPATPMKIRERRQTMVEQRLPGTPSRKPVASSTVTPIRRSIRPRAKRTVAQHSDVEMEEAQAAIVSDATSESSEEEKPQLTRCRHHVPIFADRLFYHYRDPRVAREWEACEKRMKTMSLEGRRTTGELRAN